MSTLVQDIRYALRTLARAPGFTIVAALTLALGIGANTAIFSVVHAVLLKPLAYDEPGQLVSMSGLVSVRGTAEVTSSAPEYRNYRDDLPSMINAAAVWPISINLTGTGNPERIQAAVVSHTTRMCSASSRCSAARSRPRTTAGASATWC